MDVRCERCSTEYEFDDALVSGRGTTVKCTNCGHKFKIRRKDGDFSEDFWNIQTGDGRTLVFTSLRELQRAIQTHLVDRNDLLSRGGLKQKAIGQIPELAPFFDQRDVKSGPLPVAGTPSETGRTLGRSAQPAALAPVTAAPATPPAAAAGATRERMSTRPDFPPPPPDRSELPPASSLAAPGPGTKTLLGTGDVGGRDGSPSSSPTVVADRPRELLARPSPSPARDDGPVGTGGAPTPAVPVQAALVHAAAADALPVPASPALRERLGSLRPSEAPPVTEREPEPDTQRFAREQHRQASAAGAAPAPLPTTTQRIDPIYLPKQTPPPPAFEGSSPLPAPTHPVVRTTYFDEDEEPVIDSRESLGRHSASLPEAPSSMGRRRSVGGYVVAIVVLAGVGLIGAVWAKDHLGALLGRPAPTPVASAETHTDPRVATLLTAGEKALAESNLELAKESFDKASALAEKEPRVLLDLARLAATRADAPWLKSRLLADGAADEARLTRDELTERAAAAKKAADEALSVAPEDPAAVRAKIDALRIAGDREGARALVPRIAASGAQPETAYVLASLDLAENEPLLSTVVERLKVAAAAEQGPGRARAALVYALARGGDVGAARAEVDRLGAMPRPHPLLPLLRAFVDRARPGAKLDGGAPVDDGGALATGNGRQRPGDRDPGGDRAGTGKGAISGDGRQLVLQGEKARAKGDLDRAQMLFAAALDRNPNDTEALNGLAAIAHARHDLNGARASYKRVLSINPSYVPALVGVGDVDWESGDRASAMKTYKEIIERFPEGSYPARVKQRAEPAAGATPPGTGSTGNGATPPPETGGGG